MTLFGEIFHFLEKEISSNYYYIFRTKGPYQIRTSTDVCPETRFTKKVSKEE